MKVTRYESEVIFEDGRIEVFYSNDYCYIMYLTSPYIHAPYVEHVHVFDYDENANVLEWDR